MWIFADSFPRLAAPPLRSAPCVALAIARLPINPRAGFQHINRKREVGRGMRDGAGE